MAVWKILQQAHELRAARRPFVLASVVRCERPASARPGDQALVTLDGALYGWVGGSCTEPVIVREALDALREEQARLVRLGPPETLPAEPPEGMVAHPMTCHSGGTLEIFVDPCLPETQIVIVGHSPVATTLAALASAVAYEVVVCDVEATQEDFPTAQHLLPALESDDVTLDTRTYVVVSTHGEADEEALAVALQSPASYVTLVASRRRADAAREALLELGLSSAEVQRLQSPAGLDIGAQTPQEIAAAILAEIIQHRRTTPATWEEVVSAMDALPATAVDPVCGMTVEVTATTPSAVYEGETYYFCCIGCRRHFEGAPTTYVNAYGR